MLRRVVLAAGLAQYACVLAEKHQHSAAAGSHHPGMTASGSATGSMPNRSGVRGLACGGGGHVDRLITWPGS
jgi:hypothetical protein